MLAVKPVLSAVNPCYKLLREDEEAVYTLLPVYIKVYQHSRWVEKGMDYYKR